MAQSLATRHPDLLRRGQRLRLCHFPGGRPDHIVGAIEASQPLTTGTDPPSWRIEAAWRHADGGQVLADRHHWSLRPGPGQLRLLDLDWTLRALTDVRVDDHAYGGLYVRMPFRRALGATVLNSAGQRDDAAKQQLAKWVPTDAERRAGAGRRCIHLGGQAT